MATSEYTPTIGLEVHAELKTETKMFCNSRNAPEGAAPNTHICPVCMGHPGTLPAVNKKAVEAVVHVGMALGGQIAEYTEFDRKNYFYPDIPKGYQISQYARPLVSGGELHGVLITRVHLEEDTARSLHDQIDGSIIDYNRAGVPLMELVTEPVLHDARTASEFAKELQLLLRSLGVSDAHMERGQMRVEANISVGKGTTLGTKVEVKNLNSFKAVESAIEYEVTRQIAHLEEGGTVVQETRGWDEVRQKTFSQRKKESSHDYRYFPDPDIPKLNLSKKSALEISRPDEIKGKKPYNKRINLAELGLPRNQIEIIIADTGIENFFAAVTGGLTNSEAHRHQVILTANYVTSDLIGLLSQKHITTSELHESAHTGFATLVSMVLANEITSRVFKDLLPAVVCEGKDPRALVAEQGLTSVATPDALKKIVEEVIAENPGVVTEYRGGKISTLQYLVGQGMKLSKGSAEPTLLRQAFQDHLK